MNRNLFHNLLFTLSLLTLPAVTQASPPPAPAFSGLPATFIGSDFSPSNGSLYLKLSLAREEKFTGRFDIPGGSRNVIRGTLDVSGSVSGVTTPSQTPYWLKVTGSTPSTYVITGSTAGQGFVGLPLAYMKGHSLTQAGTYTAVLEVSGTGAAPTGFGFGTLHVSKTGATMFAGKLPDGTSFTASSNVVADGTSAYLLILNDQSIYNRKGLLTGFLAFQPMGLMGDFTWQKPVTKGPYYPAAFSVSASLTGFPYSKTVSDVLTSGTMELIGGMLQSSGTLAGFTVSNKRFVFNPPNSLNLKLSINAATAAVKGSFDFPGTNSKVKLNGLVLQDGTIPVTLGYFRSPIISGSASTGFFEALP